MEVDRGQAGSGRNPLGISLSLIHLYGYKQFNKRPFKRRRGREKYNRKKKGSGHFYKPIPPVAFVHSCSVRAKREAWATEKRSIPLE